MGLCTLPLWPLGLLQRPLGLGPRTTPIAPVYSPALVAWVGGPRVTVGIGVGVSAWFPLGVGEPFVPWYHASPYYARQVNVTNVNVTYIHNTTVVNNYNNFIANTRTVNNVNQLNTANIQYANRAQVIAVPESAMASGRPVAHSAVNLTPAMRQQLARRLFTTHRRRPLPAITFAAQGKCNAPVARPRWYTSRHRDGNASRKSRRLTRKLPHRPASLCRSRPERRGRQHRQPRSRLTRLHNLQFTHTQQLALPDRAAKPPPQPKPQKAPKPPKKKSRRNSHMLQTKKPRK